MFGRAKKNAAAQRLALAMEDGALLKRHCPIFHRDSQDANLLLDYQEFLKGKVVKKPQSCCGRVVRKGGDVALLHYLFYYARDDGMNIMGMTFDDHDVDMESIVVELTGGVITGVCYEPHATAEHFWIRGLPDLMNIVVGGLRPKVYASRGKHASYPLPGLIKRYFGVADDFTDPVRVDIVCVPMTDSVAGIRLMQKRFTKDRSAIPVVRLDKVRTRLLYKMPQGRAPIIRM